MYIVHWLGIFINCGSSGSYLMHLPGKLRVGFYLQEYAEKRKKFVEHEERSRLMLEHLIKKNKLLEHFIFYKLDEKDIGFIGELITAGDRGTEQVQSCALLNWKYFRFRCGCTPVPVN